MCDGEKDLVLPVFPPLPLPLPFNAVSPDWDDSALASQPPRMRSIKWVRGGSAVSTVCWTRPRFSPVPANRFRPRLFVLLMTTTWAWTAGPSCRM